MTTIPDSEILPLSLEHTFWTWSAQGKVAPIPVTRAEGVYFWDTAGKRYLDFNSMTMCVNIGHGNQRVIDAIVAQARALPYAAPGMATRPRAELGKLLDEITPPGVSKFMFTLGGADANENAVKLARGYTGKHKILTRYRSYHGASAGAMALTGDPRRWPWEPTLMPGVVHFLDRFGALLLGELLVAPVVEQPVVKPVLVDRPELEKQRLVKPLDDLLFALHGFFSHIRPAVLGRGPGVKRHPPRSPPNEGGSFR